MKNLITKVHVWEKEGQIYKDSDGQTIVLIPYYNKDNTEQQANAELITEAFNVTNECGLTPRQLLEQRNELLDALKELYELTYNWSNDKEDETLVKANVAINNTKK